jgi:YHS domain-containing protein
LRHFLPLPIIGRKHVLGSVECEVESENMPTDPVCGAILDEKSSKFKITYEGETYYFCSITCKKRFKRHPMKFVK